MKSYFIKTPKFISSFYKNYIWHFKTDKKELYLTFDDGPTPKVTEFVLDTLSKFDAKATFFCIGKNIKQHPKLFQKIINEGHSIGNHTQNHLNGWKTSTANYINNVEQCQFNIQHSLSVRAESRTNIQHSKLFRPAYGKIKARQAKILIKKGYKIMMWSILSGDFDKNISIETCLNNVIINTEKGAVIVFHDSEKAFKNLKYTLPKVLEYYRNKGFTFKKII